MLHQLGRDEEAGISMVFAAGTEDPSSVASLHLCLEDRDAAKKALIAGLDREEVRSDVIQFVQLIEDDPLPSDYARKIRRLTDELRADPALLTAVAKYGRILPWSVASSAPPEWVNRESPQTQ